MTIQELFTDFDDNYIVTKLKPNTINGYRVNYNKHILPYIGSIDIDKLTHKDIDNLCLQLKNKGLSATSVRYVLATFRKALSFAAKRGYISGNILFTYDFPKKSNFTYTVLSDEQLLYLCHTAYMQDLDIFPAVLFAARYGMRRGEALGITTDDLSCTHTGIHFVSVNRNVNDSNGNRYIFAPKNKSSRRQICLTEQDYNLLEKYSAKRKTLIHNGYEFLCRSSSGSYVTTDKLQREFKWLLDFCEFPDIRFHDLRHSYATMMLRFGVNPKIVSDVLGHSDVSTTLDIYSHSDLSMQQALLDVLE